ncbi:hypothetical protein DUNSADRAFT_3287, partial [Dunaliella salina]
DAVRALAAILTQPSAEACVREGVLRALGSLCMSRDEVRRQLIDAKVLKHIIEGLKDPADGVRGAGALCVMALSRSVKTLRCEALQWCGKAMMWLASDVSRHECGWALVCLKCG